MTRVFDLSQGYFWFNNKQVWLDFSRYFKVVVCIGHPTNPTVAEVTTVLRASIVIQVALAIATTQIFVCSHSATG